LVGRANVGSLGRRDGCHGDAEPPLASSLVRPCRGSSSVEPARHAEAAAIHDAGRAAGCSRVVVPEQRLEGAHVRARLEEGAGEAEAAGVRGRAPVERRWPRRVAPGLQGLAARAGRSAPRS